MLQFKKIEASGLVPRGGRGPWGRGDAQRARPGKGQVSGHQRGLGPGVQGGLFVAFHGSWNRAPLPQGGYNVVFQPMKDGKAVNTEFETIPDVKDPWKELNPPK